jgi:hypothetical protein
MGNKFQSRSSGKLRDNNVTDCIVRETALNKVTAPTGYKPGVMLCVFTASVVQVLAYDYVMNITLGPCLINIR